MGTVPNAYLVLLYLFSFNLHKHLRGITLPLTATLETNSCFAVSNHARGPVAGEQQCSRAQGEDVTDSDCGLAGLQVGLARGVML